MMVWTTRPNGVVHPTDMRDSRLRGNDVMTVWTARPDGVDGAP